MCLYTGKPNGKSGEIAGTSHSFNDKIFRIQTFETCYSLATFKFSQSVAAFLISTECCCCCISKPDLFDRQLCLVLVVVMVTVMEVTMMMNVNDNGDDHDKDDCDDDNYN